MKTYREFINEYSGKTKESKVAYLISHLQRIPKCYDGIDFKFKRLGYNIVINNSYSN